MERKFQILNKNILKIMSSFIDEVMGYDPQDLSVFQPAETTNSYDEHIYKTQPKMSKSEDGVYRARVRLLLNPFDFKESIVSQASYFLKDINGGWLVRSSNVNNSDPTCPLFKGFMDLWRTKDKAKQDWAKQMYQQTRSQWCLVQIMEDANQPELVGQIRVMKLPKAIYVKLLAKMNPSAESKITPYPVMDYLIGLPLFLQVTPGPDDPQNPERKQREIKYDLCEFEQDVTPIEKVDGTPLFTEDELDTIETYKTNFDALARAKTPKKKEEAQAKLNDMRTEIKTLYSKALEYLKQVSIDPVEECAYHEWTPEIATRVQRWIDIVGKMHNPENTTWESLFATEQAQAAAQVTPSIQPVQVPQPADDALPF